MRKLTGTMQIDRRFSSLLFLCSAVSLFSALLSPLWLCPLSLCVHSALSSLTALTVYSYLCPPPFCVSPSFCSPYLCTTLLSDLSLCFPSLCSLPLCSPSLCSLPLCSPSICSLWSAPSLSALLSLPVLFSLSLLCSFHLCSTLLLDSLPLSLLPPPLLFLALLYYLPFYSLLCPLSPCCLCSYPLLFLPLLSTLCSPSARSVSALLSPTFTLSLPLLCYALSFHALSPSYSLLFLALLSSSLCYSLPLLYSLPLFFLSILFSPSAIPLSAPSLFCSALSLYMLALSAPPLLSLALLSPSALLSLLSLSLSLTHSSHTFHPTSLCSPTDACPLLFLLSIYLLSTSLLSHFLLSFIFLLSPSDLSLHSHSVSLSLCSASPCVCSAVCLHLFFFLFSHSPLHSLCSPTALLLLSPSLTSPFFSLLYLSALFFQLPTFTLICSTLSLCSADPRLLFQSSHICSSGISVVNYLSNQNHDVLVFYHN